MFNEWSYSLLAVSSQLHLPQCRAGSSGLQRNSLRTSTAPTFLHAITNESFASFQLQLHTHNIEEMSKRPNPSPIPVEHAPPAKRPKRVRDDTDIMAAPSESSASMPAVDDGPAMDPEEILKLIDQAPEVSALCCRDSWLSC